MSCLCYLCCVPVGLYVHFTDMPRHAAFDAVKCIQHYRPYKTGFFGHIVCATNAGHGEHHEIGCGQIQLCARVVICEM